MADLYEGCGEEGPIRSIFFAEFHPKQGPIIRCQVSSASAKASAAAAAAASGEGREGCSGSAAATAGGEDGDLIPKEAFDVIQVYIIPKPELTERITSLNVHGRKIVGFPRVINDNKYKRNQFMFNVCFVCYPWSRTVQFESPLRKLSEFLLNLELEVEFLSNEENTPRLKDLLEDVLVQLNETNAAVMTVERNMLNLKVMSKKSDPPSVNEWDVPVVCVSDDVMNQENKDLWDLTSLQVMPHIDGCNHIVRIASLADVEIGLVKACVQNLVYHRVVRCIPHVFQYSNQYMVTPEIRLFRENAAFRDEFMAFLYTQEGQQQKDCQQQQQPSAKKASFADVFKLVTEFRHGTTVKDICLRNRPKRQLGIDIFRLVQYLVLKGIIRRLHRYPIHMRYEAIMSQQERSSNNHHTSNAASNSSILSSSEDFAMYKLFNGQHHLDEICVKCQVSVAEIMDKIDQDPEVIYLTR